MGYKHFLTDPLRQIGARGGVAGRGGRPLRAGRPDRHHIHARLFRFDQFFGASVKTMLAESFLAALLTLIFARALGRQSITSSPHSRRSRHRRKLFTEIWAREGEMRGGQSAPVQRFVMHRPERLDGDRVLRSARWRETVRAPFAPRLAPKSVSFRAVPLSQVGSSRDRRPDEVRHPK
jgi:hypothetical protein